MEQKLVSDESYKRGVYFLPLDSPPGVTVTVKNTIESLKDGPCELLIREQEMPPIDELDRTTKYTIGVAMRFIGYALDQEHQTPDSTLRIYGALCEAAGGHLEQYYRGERGPFTVSQLVDALLSITGALFEHVDIRKLIEKYVDHALRMVPIPDDRPITAGTAIADEDVIEACSELIGRVPTFHIPSDIFDQCELSKWPVIRLETSLLPHDAFIVAVDGETWLPIKQTPWFAQSEWIIVDARRPIWYLYEQAKFRGAGVKANAVQISGITFNPANGKSQGLESKSVYVVEDGSPRPTRWPDKEAGRLTRVAVSVMMLLRNRRVAVTPGPILGHWAVTIPNGSTVDDLIDEVLS